MMKNQMKIQDNFLPQEQYETIKDTMMAADFPWFYNSSVLYGTDHDNDISDSCLLYTSPSPRDRTRSRMPSSA